MDNISYIISETVSETVSSESAITHDFDIQLYNLEEDNSIYTDTMYADTVNYTDLYTLYTTYSVKSLLQIVSYYKLNCYTTEKKRLLKEEIILLLITFELDFINKAVVLKRLRLWENIAELSQDSYFKSFITFSI
jgi:hypothetical protein